MAKVTFEGMVNEADPTTVLEYPNEQDGEPNYVLPQGVEVDVPDAVAKALQEDETVKLKAGGASAPADTTRGQGTLTTPKDTGSGS